MISVLLIAGVLVFLFVSVGGVGRGSEGTINGQIFATVGESGSGKSFCRMVWAIRYFFPRPHLGYLVTNVPFNVDAVAEYFEDRSKRVDWLGRPLSKVDGADIRRRLKILPPNDGILGGFMREEGDPETFLDDVAREYGIPEGVAVHWMLDEMHYYCGTSQKQAWRDRWKRALSTIRKQGCRFELMTQAWSQIPGFLQDVCEAQIRITAAGSRREPIFKIPYQDWYNLRAALPGWLTFGAFTGYWESSAWVKEVKGFDGSDESISMYKVALTSSFFRFYETADSYAKSDDSDAARVLRIKQDWEVFDRSEVITNFLKQYKLSLIFSPWFGFAVCGVLFCVLPVRAIAAEAIGSSLGFMTDSLTGKDKRDETSVKSEGVVAVPAVVSPVVLPRPVAVQTVSAVVSDVVSVVESEVETPEPLSVQLIDGDGIYYDHLYYRIGEALETGDGAGESVSLVDLVRGRGRTDAGRLLRLASDPVRSDENGVAADAIPGSVQTTGESEAARDSSADSGKADNGADGRNTIDRSSAVLRSASPIVVRGVSSATRADR